MAQGGVWLRSAEVSPVATARSSCSDDRRRVIASDIEPFVIRDCWDAPLDHEPPWNDPDLCRSHACSITSIVASVTADMVFFRTNFLQRIRQCHSHFQWLFRQKESQLLQLANHFCYKCICPRKRFHESVNVLKPGIFKLLVQFTFSWN